MRKIVVGELGYIDLTASVKFKRKIKKSFFLISIGYQKRYLYSIVFLKALNTKYLRAKLIIKGKDQNNRTKPQLVENLRLKITVINKEEGILVKGILMNIKNEVFHNYYSGRIEESVEIYSNDKCRQKFEEEIYE